jgi:hypothetical protein
MRRALFVVLAAIAALAITAFASAGGKPPTNPNNPLITFESSSPADNATVTSADVTYAFTFNRTPKQVASVTCALSGQASVSGSCDTPVPFPPDSKNTSKSGESYTGLANGEYTFTATLTLTGGGVYTATRGFTVAVPPPDPYPASRATCEGAPLPGTFVLTSQTFDLWICTFDTGGSTADTAKLEALDSRCVSDGGIHIDIGGTSSRISGVCDKE